MPHWRSFMDSDLLGAWDFPEKKDYTLTIEHVEGGELHNPETHQKVRKPVVSFKGARKKLVLNSTNCKALESLYGSDVDGWVGKKATLYVSRTRNPRASRNKPEEPKQVDCIRIRPVVPE